MSSVEIAQIAAAAGWECTIGSNLEWEIGSAAMLHLAAVVPSLSTAVSHDIIGPLYHTQHLGGRLSIKDGQAIVPSEPGLGVEIPDPLEPTAE